MWNNLISGLLGAVIAVVITYWLQEYAQRKAYKRNVNAFLLAIKTEITILQERFNDNYELIKKKDGSIMFYFYIEQNYFLVLDGQSSLLGEILDEDLREIIIKTYIHIKSLIDSFRTNNLNIEKFENNQKSFLQDQSNSTLSAINQEYLKILTDYADSIRKLIEEVEANIANLICLIDKYLNKHSFGCFICGGKKFT